MLFKGYKFGMLLQIAVGPVCLFIFQAAASAGFATAEDGAVRGRLWNEREGMRSASHQHPTGNRVDTQKKQPRPRRG